MPSRSQSWQFMCQCFSPSLQLSVVEAIRVKYLMTLGLQVNWDEICLYFYWKICRLCDIFSNFFWNIVFLYSGYCVLVWIPLCPALLFLHSS